MFPVIKNNFKEPIGARCKIFFALIRSLRTIVDAFDVKIGEWRDTILAVALVRRCRIDACRVLCFEFVKDDVAFVIECSFQQPLENSRHIGRVCDAAFWILAVNTSDIVLRDSAPVQVAIGSPLPTFNSSK